jgi:hypothetical protein
MPGETVSDPFRKAGSTVAMEVVLGTSLGLLAAMLYLTWRHDGDLPQIRATSTLYHDMWLLTGMGAGGGALLGVALGIITKGGAIGRRLGRVVFIGIPSLMTALYIIMYVMMGTVVPYNTARLMLAVFASILPAALFYLFLTNRRVPRLNALLLDLTRLNVTESRSDGYLERFQAVFGHISPLRLDAIRGQLRARSPGQIGSVEFDLPISALLPITLLTLACTTAWLLAMLPLDQADSAFPLVPLRHPSVYALLGSYAFSVHFLLWRYFTNDLTPNAYLGVLRRMLVGLIVGWVLTEGVLPTLPGHISEELKLVTGFFAGTFPAVAWDTIIGTVVSRLTLSSTPKFASQAPLHLIDGMNVWHESRLEEEDILSIQNMAQADLIHLIIHTRFGTQRLVDWIDQAMLLEVLASENPDTFRQKRAFLNTYGIRAASYVGPIADLNVVTGSVTFGDQSMEAAAWLKALARSVAMNPNLAIIRSWLNAVRNETDSPPP